MPSLDMPVPESAAEALEYYKSQIRELEDELADFQQSSRELERELEKELEQSEKTHRDLVAKNEGLGYEVEEWKTKYKQAKAEANASQNTLQKEITALREANRDLVMKLRDTEVLNDDFERQDRIVKSSLEDLESKLSQSVERGIIQQEEIAAGEQERETLRIECQRLRDELSDLKIEQEITIEKLNNAMAMAAKYGHGSLHHVPPPTTFTSPLSETSSVTDSPSTPMTNHTSTPQSVNSSPPSPPMSEVSTTPSQSSRITRPLDDPATTPRPRHYQKPRKHSRGPSLGGPPGSALPMPSSRSLHHIRGLIGQMQRLEQRVQTARSKLPGPVNTPPRASPRLSNHGPPSMIPSSNITIRSHKKSRPPSTASSVTSGGEREDMPFGFHYASRTSMGGLDRPSSRATDRPASRTALSRPSSRASGTTSRSSLVGPGFASGIPQRPQSRASMSASGRATPGPYDYDTTPTQRERRSVGGDTDGMLGYGLGSRRNTLNNGSAIPLPRRSVGGRRSGIGGGSVAEEGEAGSTIGRRQGKKLSGVGEG